MGPNLWAPIYGRIWTRSFASSPAHYIPVKRNNIIIFAYMAGKLMILSVFLSQNICLLTGISDQFYNILHAVAMHVHLTFARTMWIYVYMYNMYACMYD